MLRAATRADVGSIVDVMRSSLLFAGLEAYTRQQIESALAYIARPDEQLIDDGTYFVVVAGGEIVGCGGWSRRRKVYSGSAASAGDDDRLDPAKDRARIRAMFVRPEWGKRGIGRMILDHAEGAAINEGFRSFQLMALRSAGGIYEGAGYRPIEESPITLVDGVILDCTLMTKSI